MAGPTPPASPPPPQGAADEWRWTLNWDEIVPGVIVGSCPRSAADVDAIAAHSGATAILSLQSDLCLDALQVDLPAIQARAAERGMLYARAAVRDFDRNDQILMLPEAVRLLATLASLDATVYVHCTAGINRAALCVVGFLTWHRGLPLDAAVHAVKAARPQTHPYLDCWRAARRRALDGRGEEVGARARARFEARAAAAASGATGDNNGDDGVGDWIAAEAALLAEAGARGTQAARTLLDSAVALERRKADAAVAAARGALAAAKADADAARRALAVATGGGDSASWAAAAADARADADALRDAVAAIGDEAAAALGGAA